MRIGLGVGAVARNDIAVSDLVELFVKAEEDGFKAVWISHSFASDSIMLMSLAGASTSELELGTFVVPTYTRHPIAMAQQALTAASATNGRFTLGIGLSHKTMIEGIYGLDYSKPIRHMREYLNVLNGVLAGEPFSFHGEEYDVEVPALGVGQVSAPSVIVAALGPQMLRLCGRLSEGTATWLGSKSYLANQAIPIFKESAAKAGRENPRIIAGIPVAVTDDIDAAKQTAAKTFANYGTIPSYRAVLDAGGAADPEDVVIVGNEQEVTDQIRQLSAIGVTDLNAVPYSIPSDKMSRTRTRELLSVLAREF
tara:strand:+ start:1258 stop:2187 length:930 start_codon:yes stop_codon:yes gene_type:complete